MITLIASFGVAAIAAFASWWMARHWWTADIGAPRLETATIDAAVLEHRGVARWVRAHLDPGVATGSVLFLVGAVAAVGAIVLGVILEMVRSHRGFAAFDGSAARFGASHATTVSTDVLRIMTQAGGAYVVVPLAVVVGLLEIRRIRSWATVWFLTIVVGGQFVLANLIKAAVHRARPDLLRLTGFSGPSFPSGHATAASATFAAVALLAGRRRTARTKEVLAALAAGGAVLIAATRVLLGVHWLTDVLAGLALGWTWFAVTSIAFGGRRLRFGAPAAAAEAAADHVDAETDHPPAPAQRPAAATRGDRPRL